MINTNRSKMTSLSTLRFSKHLNGLQRTVSFLMSLESEYFDGNISYKEFFKTQMT